MTAKDKAIELVNKFNHFRDNKKKEYIIYQDPTESIRCALITVDELIYETQFEVPNIRQRYWQEVKHEIHKL
jgi:hypothetical protein